VTKRRRLRGAASGVADLPLGSWRRTSIVALAVVAAFAAVVAVASRYGDLRHASFPGHPYPPAGFYVNPFDSNNPDDLVKASEAARVKADLLSDGQVELQALRSGDPSLLAPSTTGNELLVLRKLIDGNNAHGVYEWDQPWSASIIVGRLPDPAHPRVAWCVEERGSGSVTYIAKDGGQVQQAQDVTFDNRFWLVQVGERYLITDVAVHARQEH
jgi:hypothetical protein